ncbi:MAG: hypothetical protein AAF829_04110, partial [Pseudomonadota bacterium]
MFAWQACSRKINRRDISRIEAEGEQRNIAPERDQPRHGAETLERAWRGQNRIGLGDVVDIIRHDVA